MAVWTKILCNFICFAAIVSGFIPSTRWTRPHYFHRHLAILSSRKGKGIMPDGSYSWTETLNEIEVRVKVPMETKTSDVVHSIQPKFVKLAIGNKVLIEGELRGRVRVDGSCWNFDSSDFEHVTTGSQQKEIVLKLEKKFKIAHLEEEWGGVLNDLKELNATSDYQFDPRDKFDMKRYLEYMGGYNER